MKKEYIIILFVIIAAFTATAAFFYPSFSTDAWWHISSGREIAKIKALPANDDFYCGGNRAWYAHEWAFDAAIFSLYYRLGERGVKSVFSFVFFLILLIIFFTAQIRAPGEPAAVIAASFIACALLIPYTEERPHIATMAAMALFMLACSFKPSKNNLIYFYLLVPLALIWTNFHSAAPAGIYLFVVSFFFNIYGSVKENRKILTINGLIIAGLLGLSVLFSPIGLKALVFFGEDAWLKQYINEWRGIISNGGPGYLVYAAALIAAGIAGIFLSAIKLIDKKTRLEAARDLFIIVPLFISVFITKKTILLFVIVLTPVIAASLAGKGARVLRIIAALAGLAMIFLFLTNRVIIGYPEQAMQFIKNSKGGGCVLTSFEWGGYAEYELYPEYKIYLNGRLNASEDTIRRYSDICNTAGQFQAFVKESGIDFYVLRHNSPLAVYFLKSNIKPVYEDMICSVFPRVFKY